MKIVERILALEIVLKNNEVLLLTYQKDMQPSVEPDPAITSVLMEMGQFLDSMDSSSPSFQTSPFLELADSPQMLEELNKALRRLFDQYSFSEKTDTFSERGYPDKATNSPVPIISEGLPIQSDELEPIEEVSSLTNSRSSNDAFNVLIGTSNPDTAVKKGANYGLGFDGGKKSLPASLMRDLKLSLKTRLQSVQYNVKISKPFDEPMQGELDSSSVEEELFPILSDDLQSGRARQQSETMPPPFIEFGSAVSAEFMQKLGAISALNNFMNSSLIGDADSDAESEDKVV